MKNDFNNLNGSINNLNSSVESVQNSISAIEYTMSITADVQGGFLYVYTDAGSGGDIHDIDGLVINFGKKSANDTCINFTWNLDDVDYVYRTLDLGTMLGHSIRKIDIRYWFDASNRVITFSYNVTWS